jgi:hypothetical protein
VRGKNFRIKNKNELHKIIVHPGSKTATKERDEKICSSSFFVATIITKLKIILFLNW